MTFLENFVASNLTALVILITFFILLSLILIFILFFKIKKINHTSRSFFSGKNGNDLEQIILSQQKEIKSLDKDIQELFEASNKIYTLAHHGLHKVAVVRFNPFKELGGNQSFAIALLDGNKSGIVISSLHTREGTRVYSKPILEGKSEKYALTEEEKNAINIASASKKKS
ncbi:MAG: hypothetical protein UR69_C0002G0271 [Candidatus Moranbacteria bacterium GW2011_GWE2_35_2-]|nr:MAG: hypothetical protein UR69_C0002G0271 [Candidatus Moranbacteria bacterium GW2011_GWE2_35_2-]KKQ22383.1 MAG: hypothetical protein US37_C0002G0008 [Candidatus Moranbacteria bacterium GW2011_GWF2_37_11]KKQ29451.1 MAG: hypothetical protein US44_C0001G0043 [Candidatus Moranbacteria bacterium GW2011_GWD1_37_17]KKQ30681.1 MAG: hypothetical protein US47_C0002G0271 [Candidatus Moranbacteria bacterium GW2011_GWE1_37_24]KKQ47120.1 MAG: hypothetical protein US66_C0019G0006 [Candidatus Moranbacteria 